jgi:hypothetical protein
MIIVLISSLIGCNRQRYRQQADVEAYNLIREKANHAHWDLMRHWIDVDPRSRMFDPFNPDCPPMPPDDPTSHQLMHCVDGMKGYQGWDANGHTPYVDNPDWLAYLPLDENGVLNLTAEQAYQVSLIHSTDYQEQYETLYLSALDVSTERFRFDSQFFGGYSVFYTASGRERETQRSELDLSTYTEETGRLGLPAGGVRAPSTADLLWRKSFATGADLAVGLANSLIWDFAGPDEHTALTILDFSLIQPLLRRAGRDRILEQLTIAERALLANVRQMERFRRAFYVEVITGRNAGSGATRRGGVFGATGLSGFSGVGGGGFGSLGGGGAFTGGAGAAQAGGYLGLLQDQQNIRFQQTTITGLRSNLAQLRESLRESLVQIPDDPETIVRQRLQIAQARQALLNAESRLLNSQASYQAQLDEFKATLGLPPDICVNIEDSALEPFRLIDSEIQTLQDRVTGLRNRVGEINERILQSAQPAEGAAEPGALQWDDDLEINLQQLRVSLQNLREIHKQLTSESLVRVEQDVAHLEDVLPKRRQNLLSLKEKYRGELDRFERYGGLDPCQETLLADIDPLVFDVARLDALPGELRAEINRIRRQFDTHAEEIQATAAFLEDLLGAASPPDPATLQARLEENVIFAIPNLLSELSDDVLDLSLVQARAKTDAVYLVPIDLPWNQALDIAREFRRDWMNARASLVDSWRLIEFNADNLESTLDVVFEGDIRNTGDNPLRLDSSNGQLRVGMRFDAPITRLQERNTYRQSLIEYQQSKRDYYRFTDSVGRGLRNTLRTVDLNQINFEERRIAVLSAIDQVVLNDQIQKLREERGLETGVTAARDVVSALADLQDAQNDFLSVWVNYEVQRLNLDLDLGTMRLDGEGWIDPGPIGPESGLPMPDWFGQPAGGCCGAEPPLPLSLPDGNVPLPFSAESLPAIQHPQPPSSTQRSTGPHLAPPREDAAAALHRLPEP